MRIFHIFNINKDIAILTKNDGYPLYHTLYKIKNLKSDELSLGVNLYEQVASPIDLDYLDNRIYNFYRESCFYSRYRSNHSYINKYRSEKSFLTIKHSYMKLESNLAYPDFFKYLKMNPYLFACDFDNMDYFWVRDIKLLKK